VPFVSNPVSKCNLPLHWLCLPPVSPDLSCAYSWGFLSPCVCLYSSELCVKRGRETEKGGRVSREQQQGTAAGLEASAMSVFSTTLDRRWEERKHGLVTECRRRGLWFRIWTGQRTEH
jgi:hypothetical protein